MKRVIPVWVLLLALTALPRSAIAKEVLVSCAENEGIAIVEFLTDGASTPLSYKVPLGKRTPLRFEDHPNLRIRATAAHCWGPEIAWPPGDVLQIELLPLGEIVFDVEAGEGPDHVTASIINAGPEGHRTEGVSEFECSKELSRWRCRLPRGQQDVRLQAEGFSPIFLWNLEVPQELGRLTWVPGASLGGWVLVEGSNDPTAKIVIRRLGASLPRSSEESGRRSLLKQEAAVDSRGRFMLSGLNEGRYELLVEKNGFATAATEIQVPSKEHVELETPLRLVPLSEITVSLDPPLDPWARPWKVTLERETEEATVWQTIAGGVAAEGSWNAPPLRPGEIVLRVTDSLGGEWLRDRLVTVGGAEAVFRSIDVIPIRGTVSLGDAPIEASILFGSGTAAVRVASDERGEFEGSLPREGEWRVRFETDRGKIGARPVEVRKRPGKSYAELEFELPSTLIKGRVTKGGEPAEALVVAVQGRVGPQKPPRGRLALSARTDKDGLFEIAGVEPGELNIRASSQTAETEWVALTVREKEVGRVHLELTNRKTIRGRLMGPAGGLAARLIVLPDASIGLTTAADAQGQFEFNVQSQTEQIRLVVAPAQQGLFFKRLGLGAAEQEEIVVVAPAGTGALSFVPPSPRTATLFYQGVGVNAHDFLTMFPPRGNHFQGGIPLPPVASGLWSLCPTADPGDKECASASVQPGSSAVLFLPKYLDIPD
ncbi:MAG: carboxypeptidase-like regulatory domain-containing protein [Acidobacteriota bacterium]